MHDMPDIPSFLIAKKRKPLRTKNETRATLVVSPEELERKAIHFEAQRKWREWGLGKEERSRKRPRLKTLIRELEQERATQKRIKEVLREDS